MNRCLALAAGILVVFTASAAHAQSAPSRFFADAAIVADLDPNSPGEDSQPTPAVRATIGTALPHRWTARFEATIPGWHESQYSYTCSCSSGSRTFTGIEGHRLMTYGFFVGRDLSLSSRVQLTPLIGFAVVDHADRENETVTTRLSSGVTTESSASNPHEMIPALIFGADLPFALSHHVSLVPQVRFEGFPQYGSAATVVRPGVAVRIGF
jgi:hypothetical protein